MVRLAARSHDAARDRDFDLLMFLQGDAAKRQDYDQSFAVDNDFHRLICTMAGFPDVWQTIHNATGQLDRIRRFAIRGQVISTRSNRSTGRFTKRSAPVMPIAPMI